MANSIDNPRKVRKTIIQPTTREFSAWPSWRYNPKTGVGRVFNNDDEVPDGWVKHYSETKPGKGEAADLRDDIAGYRTPVVEDDDKNDDDDSEEPEELEAIEDITVNVIKKRLDTRGVPYAASASKTHLYQLLEENWAVEED